MKFFTEKDIMQNIYIIPTIEDNETIFVRLPCVHIHKINHKAIIVLSLQDQKVGYKIKVISSQQ
jgi:hypothetical protein